MKKGKRVLGIMIVSLLLISFIGVVSAGVWGDLFSLKRGDILEGELPASFEATVNLQIPPEIQRVYDVIDNVNTEAGDNEIIPLLGSINEMEIRFLVEDLNGVDDLPGGTEPISLVVSVGDVDPNAATSGANMEVYVTNPGFDYDSENYLASFCVEDTDCTLTGGCGAKQREYSCTVPMQYYYEPGPVDDGDPWQITIAIADTTDNFDSNSKTFTYQVLYSYDIIAPPIDEGISWEIGLDDSNQVAEGDPVSLANFGNFKFTVGEVIGYNLIGVEQTGDDLPVSTFSVGLTTGDGGDSIPDECAGENNALGAEGQTANELVDEAPITINAVDSTETFSLTYGDGVSNINIADSIKDLSRIAAFPMSLDFTH